MSCIRHAYAQRRLAALVAAASALSPACQSVGDLEVSEGTYVDYMWDPSFTPCTGTAATVDATVPWIVTQLERDLDHLDHLEYRWVSPEVVDATYHGSTPVEYIGGFARGHYTNVQVPTSPHELTHLVALVEEERVLPHRLLAEGLAVALEEEPHTTSSEFLISSLDPRPYIDAPLPDDLSYYDAGGSFVAYLLGRFGVERFYALLRAVPSGASGERFREEFADVYGVELDPFIDDYIWARACPDDAHPVPLPPSCGAPTIPWEDDDTWIYSRALDCGDNDVFGDADKMAEHQVTLEIPADGSFTLTNLGDAWQQVLLKPCAPCPWLRERKILDGGEQREVELEAGRYSLRILFPGDVAALAGVALTRVADDS